MKDMLDVLEVMAECIALLFFLIIAIIISPIWLIPDGIMKLVHRFKRKYIRKSV